MISPWHRQVVHAPRASAHFSTKSSRSCLRRVDITPLLFVPGNLWWFQRIVRHARRVLVIVAHGKPGFHRQGGYFWIRVERGPRKSRPENRTVLCRNRGMNRVSRQRAASGSHRFRPGRRVWPGVCNTSPRIWPIMKLCAFLKNKRVRRDWLSSPLELGGPFVEDRCANVSMQPILIGRLIRILPPTRSCYQLAVRCKTGV